VFSGEKGNEYGRKKALYTMKQVRMKDMGRLNILHRQEAGKREAALHETKGSKGDEQAMVQLKVSQRSQDVGFADNGSGQRCCMQKRWAYT
jgi:hypothetical protein